MENNPSYQDLEKRIKILESKIIELHTTDEDSSSDLWSDMFDILPDMYFLTDAEFRLEKINKAAVNFLKRNEGEVYGRSCHELFEEHDEFCLICANRSNIQENKPCHKIVQLPQTESYFEVISIPVQDSDNKTDKILHQARDINAFKNREDELEKKSENLITTLRNLPEGIITTDYNGVILSMNERACEICHCDHDKVLGKNLQSVFTLINRYSRKEENIIERIIFDQGRQETFDQYELKVEDDFCLLFLKASFLKKKNGEIEGFVFVFSDITDKSKEEKISREHEERIKLMFEQTRYKIIQESEKKLKLRLENNHKQEIDFDSFGLTDIIDLDSLQQLQDDFAFANQVSSIIVDNDNKPITRASNFSELCKTIRKSPAGKKICVFEGDIPFDRETAKSAHRCFACNFYEQSAPIIVGGRQLGNWLIGAHSAVREENQIKDFARSTGLDSNELIEAYNKTKILSSGKLEKTVNLLWHLSKEISNLGYSILKLSKDISEQKKLEYQLTIAKEKAEESDRLKTAFLASMSHEIRTPMNAIIGFTDLLSDPDFSKEEKDEFIELVNNNGNILLRLIDDIIDIAKIEAGEFNVDETECHVNKIISEVIVASKDNLKRQGKETIELTSYLASSSENFAIISDPTRFRQIITNLIGNAQKFTMTGKIEVGYLIKNNDILLGDELFIQFYVKDTGIGIPEEKREIIFDRFKQADDTVSKKYGGTGLGLTITKKLVNLMGGEIWVESEVGKGSTFYFTLPYKPIESKEEFLESTDKKLDHIDLSGKTILIVEDVESNFNLLKTVLTKNNAKIIWAKDGKQAVDFCRAKSVDLVLMDIKLPILDGYNATERIKQTTKNIPIIAITAYARENDKLKSIQAGCDEYIPKPIKTDLLFALINKYLFKA
jgi:PAS domain S-box-containing protein